MKLWKFIPNYLARAMVVDPETSDVLLDTRTLDPLVVRACQALTELHNAEAHCLEEQLEAARHLLRIAEARVVSRQEALDAQLKYASASPDLGRVREALEECEWRGHATLAQRKECKEQSGSYDCDHFFCPICHAHDEDSDRIQHEPDCLLAEALSLLAPSTQPAPVKDFLTQEVPTSIEVKADRFIHAYLKEGDGVELTVSQGVELKGQLMKFGRDLCSELQAAITDLRERLTYQRNLEETLRQSNHLLAGQVEELRTKLKGRP